MSGLILIITPVIMAIMAPNAGKLSDKIHPQKLAAVGIGIAAIALAILSFLNGDTPLYIVILAMILQGIGMGLFSSPNMNAIMSSVPPKYAPTASASQATMRTIGQTMSLGLLTLVFAWVMGSLQLAPEYAAMIVQASWQYSLHLSAYVPRMNSTQKEDNASPPGEVPKSLIVYILSIIKSNILSCKRVDSKHSWMQFLQLLLLFWY